MSALACYLDVHVQRVEVSEGPRGLMATVELAGTRNAFCVVDTNPAALDSLTARDRLVGRALLCALGDVPDEWDDVLPDAGGRVGAVYVLELS